MADEARKTCETFGCADPAERMHAIAPATNVWLCAGCAASIDATLEKPMPVVGVATEAEVDPAMAPWRCESQSEEKV